MARGPAGRGLGAARRPSRPVARIACLDHPGHLARELRKNFRPQKVPFRGVGAPSGSVGGWLEGRGESTFRARHDVLLVLLVDVVVVVAVVVVTAVVATTAAAILFFSTPTAAAAYVVITRALE